MGYPNCAATPCSNHSQLQRCEVTNITDLPAARWDCAAGRLTMRTCAVMSAALIEADFSTSTMTSQKFLRKAL